MALAFVQMKDTGIVDYQVSLYLEQLLPTDGGCIFSVLMQVLKYFVQQRNMEWI